MAFKITGKVVSEQKREFDYVDRKTGKTEKGVAKTIFVVDGGRPVEVRVPAEMEFKSGQEIDLQVYVIPFQSKSGYIGVNVIHPRKR